MFGKPKIEFPKIDAAFIEMVRSTMQDAESVLPGKSGAEKKAWVKNKVTEAAKKIDLKGIPGFLENIVRDALVGVIVDSVWALVFKKKKD